MIPAAAKFNAEAAKSETIKFVNKNKIKTTNTAPRAAPTKLPPKKPEKICPMSPLRWCTYRKQTGKNAPKARVGTIKLKNTKNGNADAEAPANCEAMNLNRG